MSLPVRNTLKLIMSDKKSPLRGFFCILIVTIILIAGLWPFNFFPKNNVTWIGAENGIRFYGVGAVQSAKLFSFRNTIFRNGSFSIELLLRPRQKVTDGAPSILTLYNQQGIAQFIIEQWQSMLIVERLSRSANPSNQHAKIGIEHVFYQEQARLLTITSSNQGTMVYLDGEPCQMFPNFPLLSAGISGAGGFMFGNFDSSRSYWGGDILGFAVYDHVLDNHEVQSHKNMWSNARWSADMGAYPLGLYQFSEKNGSRIVNNSGFLSDLYMPTFYKPLRKNIMRIPWQSQFFNRSNLLDIAVNIVGFIPLGLFLAAWLRSSKNPSSLHCYTTTILLGFSISLAIELLQVYLPTRDSSFTDVISNTLGTAAGSLIFAYVSKPSYYFK